MSAIARIGVCHLATAHAFQKLVSKKNNWLKLSERDSPIRYTVKLFEARLFPLLAEKARKRSIFLDRDNLRLRHQ